MDTITNNIVHNRNANTGRPYVLSWLVLVLFAVSIPFEYANVLGSESNVTLSRICGFALAAVAIFLKPRSSFSRLPIALAYFTAYTVVTALSAIGHSSGNFVYEEIQYMWGLLQMLVMFVIMYNMMRDQRLETSFLISFGLACGVLAVLTASGITQTISENSLGARVSAFNQNLNRFANVMSIGGLCALSFIDQKEKAFGLRNALALFVAIACGLAVVNSGSRGGLVSFLAGVIVYAWPTGRKSWLRLGVLLVLVSVTVWLALHSTVNQNRWEMTLQEGSFGERENIFPVAWRLWLESPLIGWGPFDGLQELGSRLGLSAIKDAHNVYLRVLVESGLAGGLSFFGGLIYCGLGAIRRKRLEGNPLPLALLTTILIASLSGSIHNRKYFWFVLALSLVHRPRQRGTDST